MTIGLQKHLFLGFLCSILALPEAACGIEADFSHALLSDLTETTVRIENIAALGRNCWARFGWNAEANVLEPLEYYCDETRGPENVDATVIDDPVDDGPGMLTGQGIVGPEGGVILGGAGSDLSGLQVKVPKEALAKEQLLTFANTIMPRQLPHGYFAAREPVRLAPEGLIFDISIDITLPYNDKDNDGIVDGTNLAENNTGVAYFNPLTGKWLDCQVINRDQEYNLVTFSTNHFSTYLVYVGDTSLENLEDTGAVDALPFAGEYFIGTQDVVINNKGEEVLMSANEKPYTLTIRVTDVASLAVVSPKVTYGSGFSAQVDENALSATFDATAVFPKVAATGSVSRWQWQCEFVCELSTFLFHECRDAIIETPGEEEEIIECRIEADDSDNLTITWGFDVFSNVWNILAIEFWAIFIE